MVFVVIGINNYLRSTEIRLQVLVTFTLSDDMLWYSWNLRFSGRFEKEKNFFLSPVAAVGDAIS